jgi:hypothetical protein
MHRLDQYRGTVVACRYHLSADLDLATLKSSIVNALARVVLDQPHLHVGITDDETRHPAFLRLGQLDLCDHLEWQECDDPSQAEKLYIDAMQTQLDSRFEDILTRPGWRLIILHQPKTSVLDILYVWNHSHHDGMSGKIFHRQFLRALNDSNAQDKILVNTSTPNWILKLPNDVHKLPPNGEILCSWPLDYMFLLKWLYNDFKPVSFFPGAPHASWAPIKCTPYATKFRTFTIDAATIENLVFACRVHDTTVTGLMHALVLVSLTSSLQPASGKGFASRTPYDLRHFLPARTPEYPWLDPTESMCNWDSVLDHEFSPKLVGTIRDYMAHAGTDSNSSGKLPNNVMDIIWTISAEIRAEIAARIAMATKNDLLAVMGWCPDWNSQQQREARRTRYLSWLVTNLGVIDGKDQGNDNWSLDRAELVLSAEVPSATFSVSLMTVKDKQMCVTCSWQECVVEERVGDRLLSDLETWLNGIGA